MFFKRKTKEQQDCEPDKIKNYTHFLVLPLKICGFWDWFPKPTKEYQIIINNVYVSLVLFLLTMSLTNLLVIVYTEWVDIMESLEMLADGIPLLVSILIVSYFFLYKKDSYDLIDYMNHNFKFHSAMGLTNMTMYKSYSSAINFAYTYTACTLFSVSNYVFMPMILHLSINKPLSNWVFIDVKRSPYFEIMFLLQCLTQGFVGLAFGQLGVFIASNAILLGGQLELLCCSLRNSRYTALLKSGVPHWSLKKKYSDIVNDERHQYIISQSIMKETKYHYDKREDFSLRGRKSYFDIYSAEFDVATEEALRDCAKMCQVVANYKLQFEAFVSPLLVLRVVQVTLYLCTLLYAASQKFDMVTVEYLAAVSLDIFIYSYYGNQIHIQADRVSTAAYQSAWHTMGVQPRRLLLNILLAHKRTVKIRAGRFLPMDLHTFLIIIKTSFSYYTLLVNVNDGEKPVKL